MWSDGYEKVMRAHCRLVDDGSPLDPEAPMASLGVDSMEIVSLIVDLEEEFGFEIPEELVTPDVFATLGTLWTALGGRFSA